MLSQTIAHPIGVEITGQIDNASLRHWYVTESGIEYFEQWMEHVLHWVCGFGELVEHHHYRFSSMDTEPSVGIIASHAILMVDHRHAHVTEIKIGAIEHG